MVEVQQKMTILDLWMEVFATAVNQHSYAAAAADV